MEQLEFFNIPSPCTGVCEVNNRGYCKGCLRNRDERLYWHSLNDAQRRRVMHTLNERRDRIRRLAAEKKQAAETPAENVPA